MQVNVSLGGIPKVGIPSADVTETGIVGDAWRYPFHGGRQQAILLMTWEGINELISQGFALFPGALGENLTTLGLDRRGLQVGQRFQVGRAAIRLTRVRLPCTTLDVYGSRIQAEMYDTRVQAGDAEAPRWGLSGFYASVVQPGVIRPGDPVMRLE